MDLYRAFTFLLSGPLLLSGFCDAPLARAGVDVDTAWSGPARARGDRVAAVLALTETEYDTDGGGEVELDRRSLGVGYRTGFSPDLDVLLQGAYSMKSEVDDSNFDGNGWQLGGGLTGRLLQEDEVTVMLFGMLSWLQDRLDAGNADMDVQVTRLIIGSTGSFRFRPDLYLTGGLELTPYTDGSSEVSTAGLSSSTDLDPDDPVVLKLGARMGLKDYLLRIDLAFSGESSLYLGIGRSI